MKLLCPCNEYIKIDVINGVITYMHEGGSYCKELNSFDSDCNSFVWNICKKAIDDNDHKTFNVYMCTITKSIMASFVEHIRYLNKVELIKLFRFTFNNPETEMSLQIKLAHALIEEHGKYAFDNIVAAFGGTLPSGFTTSYVGSSIRRKPMINIVLELRSKTSNVKENIASDLARSFAIENSKRQSVIANAIRSNLWK